MKYEITNEQLKELLGLQKESTDALGECSKIGIELEGMRLRIPQEWALLNMVFDILGLPQEGFTRFEKENPKLSNPELCEQFQKHMDNEPYSFCRDNLISDCFKHLDKSGIDKCLEYMIEAVQEWKQLENKKKQNKENKMGTLRTNKNISVDARIPEHVSIKYLTTGEMGGDAGHGGETELILFFEQGADVSITDSKNKQLYLYDEANCEPVRIKIRVRGDWEMSGMEYALKKIGLKLIDSDVENND